MRPSYSWPGVYESLGATTARAASRAAARCGAIAPISRAEPNAAHRALAELEAAGRGLDQRSEMDVSVVRTLARRPPRMEAVCLLVLYLKPGGAAHSEDWEGCKAMLAAMEGDTAVDSAGLDLAALKEEAAKV